MCASHIGDTSPIALEPREVSGRYQPAHPRFANPRDRAHRRPPPQSANSARRRVRPASGDEDVPAITPGASAVVSTSLLCRLCCPAVRDRRRIMRATAVAAALSGAPSTLDAFRRQRDLRSVMTYVWDTTCSVGTLVPLGQPDFMRGALLHVGISVLCGEGLARTVPETNSVIWGAGAGLVIGVINVGVIGRRFPAIAALPLVPQLADNVAFGALFAFVVDR